MQKNIMSVGFILALSGCGFVDSYEKAVYDFEPLYCYQSLASVECFRQPNHADKLRLVNYYGPHPSRYDAPEPAPVPELKSPPAVPFWVRDPEPVPESFVKMTGRSGVPAASEPILQSPNLPPPVSQDDKDEIKKSRITEPLPPQDSEAKGPDAKDAQGSKE